jgi:cytosine/adenosine deaminase-related metal-dependent hydrolase
MTLISNIAPNSPPTSGDFRRRKVIRAALVLPITSAAIQDGAVTISNGVIGSVSRFRDVDVSESDEVTDLGRVILLPGLVNSHCHLDYSAMAGQTGPAPSSFVDWIGLMTALKGGMIYSHFAESWLKGATMLLNSGTTTVADIEAVPELLPDIWAATPMRVVSFLEMTGVRSRRPPSEILGDALEKIGSARGNRNQMGVSPHAPYSTTPELLALSAAASKEHGLRVTTHVAESPEEFEMFKDARGKMYTWLQRSGRLMDDCCGVTPVEHLRRAGILGPGFLAVHANYLTKEDIFSLNETGSHVVHCPRSHDYFKFRKFPYRELRDAGVNICLGTDSLASISKSGKTLPELDMFEEMRQFSQSNPDVALDAILQMATINGARALGMDGIVGQLQKGCQADMIAIPYDGNMAEASQSVIQYKGKVSFSMIEGKWCIQSGREINPQKIDPAPIPASQPSHSL